ncbi:DUF1351 domain-containing protein [Fructobacillus cardui]|uniref:DUF1351 domain-containing protein n=1 Tax=Fructobacillus cardui TaxID=2893170 RepID=A0ABM9N1L6_9LACO|nr:hypothetical protein R82641_BJNNKPBH_01457 [Fructobacillus cardui]
MEDVLTLPANDFSNGKIEFKGVDDYLNTMNKYIDYGNQFVVTEETMKGAKNERALINNMVKSSSSWRSNTKSELLKPFEDLEETMKATEKRAKESSANIDKQIKMFEAKEEQKRFDGIQAYIDSQAEQLEIVPTVEIDKKWLVKKNFNGYDPKDSFLEEVVDPLLEFDLKTKQQYDSDVQVIKQMATGFDLEPEAYISLLSYQPLSSLMAKMQADSERRKKRQESQQAIAELEAKQAAQKPVKEVADKLVDEETGEVIEQVKRYTRRVEFVNATLEELTAIAEFAKSRDIQFRSVD